MSSIKKTRKKQRVRQGSTKTGSKKAVAAKKSGTKIIAAATTLSAGMTKKSQPHRSTTGKPVVNASMAKLRQLKAKAAAEAERAAKEKLQKARAAKVRAAEAKRSAVVNSPARASVKTAVPAKLAPGKKGSARTVAASPATNSKSSAKNSAAKSSIAKSSVAKSSIAKSSVAKSSRVRNSLAKSSSAKKMSVKSRVAEAVSGKPDTSLVKEDKKNATIKAASKAATQKALPAAAKLKDGQPAAHVTRGGAPAKSPAKPAQGQFPEASDRNKVKNTKITAAPEAAPAEKVATPPSAADETEIKKALGGRTPSEKLAAVRAAAAKVAASKATPAESSRAAPSQKPSAQQPTTAKPVVPSAPAPVVAASASAPAPATMSAPAKAVAKPAPHKHGFKTSEFIVYPSHGVGQILAIEEQEVAGFRLELFIITFVKDKLTLKVPLPKVTSVGMRKLAEPEIVTKALDTLTGRARVKRTMWSRRAQEYEAKINSGDLVAIAEVVRDLYRSDAQPEQSYSERQLYEAALDRMAREIAAVQRLTEIESLKLIEGNLQKGPRRGAKADAEGDSDHSGDIEEAA
jgi:CarD family transcriptional regulator